MYLGVGTPNTWHSPTQMIAMVWMLICVPFTARCYDRFEAALPDPRVNIPWREGALLGALLLLSLTAKPTFMQRFAGGVPVFPGPMGPPSAKQPLFPQGAGLRCAGHRFMILQYMYYFGIIVPPRAIWCWRFPWKSWAASCSARC